MATTNTAVLRNHVPGEYTLTITDVVFDASYPTGGEPLTAAQLGLSTVKWAEAEVKVAGVGSVTAVRYNEATAALLAYTAAAEVANLTDLSAVTARVYAYGYR
jgi:hypothetical protein